MTIPMEISSSQLTKELSKMTKESVQRRYNKVIELEQKLKNAIQTKTPSDPSIWSQIRENYEAIILEDHDFSESHEIEHALWTLHYKRIEEFRNRIRSAGMTANNANAPPGSKSLMKRDQVNKIRTIFKSFLAEATGFYHELILKIKSKYGFPVDYFSNQGDEYFTSLEGKTKSLNNIREARISCHRCLIYLGDLARYKELYGEGDFNGRDFSVASSYYIQAASIWPSSGNPHHQLAILATYAGDELVAVYRYFRSLAVESPFSTARDNLVLIFEKNRQNYSQLPQEREGAAFKQSFTKGALRGRQRMDSRVSSKDHKQGTITMKKREVNLVEVNKTLRVRFVRLNGILFTRTSLETFDDVCSSALNELEELLSTGSFLETEDAELFTKSPVFGGLMVLQLFSILIFTVHNIMEAEKQNMTFSEILQRTVLLQNAFTATFAFAERILRKCGESEDICSCPFLPAITIFFEWLSCRPEVIDANEAKDQETTAKISFWIYCANFLNKLIDIGDYQHDKNADFVNSEEFTISGNTRYNEEEKRGYPALWEDFELRGFLPIAPAQRSLDFSNLLSYKGLGGRKERSIRLKRILAAGKTVLKSQNVARHGIYFDASLLKFVVAGDAPEKKNKVKAKTSEQPSGTVVKPDMAHVEHQRDSRLQKIVIETHTDDPVLIKEDEEDEVIVFKPAAIEKQPEHVAVQHNHNPDMNAEKLVLSSASEEIQPSSSSMPVSALASPQHVPVSASVQNRAPVPMLQESQCNFSALPVSSDLSMQVPAHSATFSLGRGHPVPSHSTHEVSIASADPWSTGFGLSNTSLSRPLDGWVNQGYNGGLTNSHTLMPGFTDFGNQPPNQMHSGWYRGQESPLHNGMMNLNLGPQVCSTDLISKPDSSVALLEPVQPQSSWITSQSLFSMTPLVSAPTMSEKLTLPNPNFDLSKPSLESSMAKPELTPLGVDVAVSTRNASVPLTVPNATSTGSIHLAVPSAKASGSASKLTFKKGTTNRPARHFGPPPGFGPVPSKSADNCQAGFTTAVATNSQRDHMNDNKEEILLDDYSWLDGYTSCGKDGEATVAAVNPLFLEKRAKSFQLQQELDPRVPQEFKAQQQQNQQKQMLLPSQQQQSFWSGQQLYG
eukprot:TRINITY_DN2618_c0_g1_i1.p1 TRINITY_DN2618_c0_g1~~TRINITY_DN2618_c0_g1_i1.p1  ORF type:complete len:1126 (-),score=267.15 TRINITY_DN2618_c0_g1_i1:602-3979(-)